VIKENQNHNKIHFILIRVARLKRTDNKCSRHGKTGALTRGGEGAK
jgi:hypothetical protein